MQTRSYTESLSHCREKIKLSQLNHLLRIYHGLEIYDLNSQIRIDTSRVKIKECSEVVKGIENLVVKMQGEGIRNDNYITDHYEKELIDLVKRGEKIETIEELPVKLLCKRVAAMMRLDMGNKVYFSKDIATEVATGCLLTGLTRIGSEFSPGFIFGYSILLMMLYTMIILKIWSSEFKRIDFRTIEFNGEKFFELNERCYWNHGLFSQKMQEYTKKLEFKAPPQILINDMGGSLKYAISVSPIPSSTIAKNGVIFLENNLNDNFDKEEICAMVAHEMGHLKESSAFKASLSIGIPIISGLFFKLLSLLTEKIPEINDDGINILNWVLMFSATILCVQQKFMSSEYNADKIAMKLAGPLAVSSVLRSIENDGRTIDAAALNQSQYPRLFKMLKTLKMDDFFNAHPTSLKRMKRAI